MSRTSQTETAVLGALSVMPMTGYAVREAIRDVLGHFWSESFGQIYPTLARLEDAGQVERESADSGAPYRITPDSLPRLRDLHAQPAPPGEPYRLAPEGRGGRPRLLAVAGQPTGPRHGLRRRLFVGRHLGSEACRGLVADARSAAEAQLATYAAVRAEIGGEAGTEADRPFWVLTVSAGEHAARGTIAWAEEALAALEAVDDGAPRRAGAGRAGHAERAELAR